MDDRLAAVVVAATAVVLSGCGHVMPPPTSVVSSALMQANLVPLTGHYEMSEHDGAAAESTSGSKIKSVSQNSRKRNT